MYDSAVDGESFLKSVGWGLFPLWGERARWERSVAKTRASLGLPAHPVTPGGDGAPPASRFGRRSVHSPATQVPVHQQGGSSVKLGRPVQARATATMRAPTSAEGHVQTKLRTSAAAQRKIASGRSTLAKELVKRYTSGESIRSLASSTGRSYGFIHRVLTESGVNLRQRGGARRRKKA